MRSLLLVILVAALLVFLALALAGRRARSRRTTGAGRPEDHGTSYGDPQDEGPIQGP